MIEAISGDIKQLFSKISTKSVQRDIEKKIEKMVQRDQKRHSMILKEIQNLKNDKTEALRLKLRKKISEEEYKLLIEDNNKRLAKLNEEKTKIESILLRHEEIIDFNELIQTLEQFVLNPVLDEEMLHKLIERIEIKEDGSPRIFYRFSAPYMSSIFVPQE